MTAPSDHRTGVIDRLTTRITRRNLAKTGGLMLAGGAFTRVELLRTSAQTSLEVAETVNVAVTLEAFAVTFFGVARGRGKDIDLDDDTVRFARTSQCEEEAHFHFFEAAGALPSTSTFTIADTRIADQKSFLASVQEFESVLVGAYMAMSRRFASTGDLGLVEVAYQTGAIEAQHQAVARLLAGVRIPNDRAYAKWMFREPKEAVEALAELGYIGGSGSKHSFPGPVDRNCRGITGLVPETTEDQPDPVTPVASLVGEVG